MEDEREIDLAELFRAVIKRWRMITCVTLLCVIVSALLSFFVITPKYEVKTQLFIGKEAADDKNQDYSYSDVNMYQNLLKTYAQLAQTDDLVTKSINEAGLNLKSKDVLKNLVVTPSADTQILELKYTDINKYTAKSLVDAITKEFIAESQSLIPNGKVEIIESAKLPEGPVSPNKTKNIAIAVVLGIVVGVGIAVFLEFTNNTVKSKEDLERLLGIPVVGIIPDEDSFN